MLKLRNLDDAERFVVGQKALGADIYWNNYDLVVFRPSEKGMYSKHGAFRNGVWGFANVSPLKNDGTWDVDFKNVRKHRKSYA